MLKYDQPRKNVRSLGDFSSGVFALGSWGPEIKTNCLVDYTQ